MKLCGDPECENLSCDEAALEAWFKRQRQDARYALGLEEDEYGKVEEISQP